MVNERASPKTVEASSNLMPCLPKFDFALFTSHSKLRAMIEVESSAISERKRLCKQAVYKIDLHLAPSPELPVRQWTNLPHHGGQALIGRTFSPCDCQ
jgi:hypothetical protein